MKVIICVLFAAIVFSASLRANTMTLENAIKVAIQHDPWLKSSNHRRSAMLSMSREALSYPDPQVSVATMNLPVDSWEFNQEGMTQLKVGVMQMLPRGDSLEIKSTQLKLNANKQPILQLDRQAQVRRDVSLLWLDMVQAKKTLSLIERDSVLFEQMVEIANASYANAVGPTRQQDVIRAQLEVMQLDDKRSAAFQQLNIAKAKLEQWLLDDSLYNKKTLPISIEDHITLPKIPFLAPQFLREGHGDSQTLVQYLARHPQVVAADVTTYQAEQGIKLAEQAYKPQFALNASYAFRDDAPNKMSRSDFFSVGVSFDLPLFTDSKQDQAKAAAIAEFEATKTDRLIVLKQLFANLNGEIQSIQRLQQRRFLYEKAIVAQSAEQAEAALTAYTNDDGDFAEVVRARIAKLNAQLSALAIDIALLKAVVRSNYYLTQVAKETTHEQ
ncbi:TolC family protein [Pseudoalteromonas sp. SCSIO 43201]|uniref:TolC family protein n=1 Tax=Pseudoalteromonas sp. SCSIO 43201 TaxID=2822842 RepID=UPI002075A648|nr:TolC family protein [Pseudoalteromonas sp. SCSIO 43201]USD30829.1 TolC family protein [Pseudoalteromonas sp. SCSIO 43201]